MSSRDTWISLESIRSLEPHSVVDETRLRRMLQSNIKFNSAFGSLCSCDFGREMRVGHGEVLDDKDQLGIAAGVVEVPSNTRLLVGSEAVC